MPQRTRLRRTTSCSTTPSAAGDIGMAMRSSDERELQPRHVAALVDQLAAPHLADFIDAVGELIAAILDVDARMRERQVAAVDIGDAGHRVTI